MRNLLLAAALAANIVTPISAQSFRDRLPEDEVIYFVLPDRFANGDPKNDTGGIKGDRMKHGFDPSSGFSFCCINSYTNDEFKAFVNAAHARGMKVYMDIITNHTADVIQYKECPTSACAYRSRADFPYSRRASDAAEINKGFEGDRVRTAENFAKLTDMNFAYTPTVPEVEANVKVPAWLNDVRY